MWSSAEWVKGDSIYALQEYKIFSKFDKVHNLMFVYIHMTLSCVNSLDKVCKLIPKCKILQKSPILHISNYVFKCFEIPDKLK